MMLLRVAESELRLAAEALDALGQRYCAENKRKVADRIAAYLRNTEPQTCTRCGQPILHGAFVGDGVGSAHYDCFYPAGR